jgi:DNA-binding MarR family transcriptional regulator
MVNFYDMPLFDIRSRRGHPASSQADCQRQNERLTASMQYALDWIRRYPGRTAKELEKIAHCEAGRIWKVVAQLERRKLIIRKSQGSAPLRIYPNWRAIL